MQDLYKEKIVKSCIFYLLNNNLLYILLSEAKKIVTSIPRHILNNSDRKQLFIYLQKMKNNMSLSTHD